MMRTLMYASVGITASLVLFLLIYVLVKGIPNITWELLTTSPSYLTEKIGKRGKLTRWIVGSVSVTLSAMTVTTPLVAYYFGAISLVGILTNLLTLWVISFIFYGIIP